MVTCAWSINRPPPAKFFPLVTVFPTNFEGPLSDAVMRVPLGSMSKNTAIPPPKLPAVFSLNSTPLSSAVVPLPQITRPPPARGASFFVKVESVMYIIDLRKSVLSLLIKTAPPSVALFPSKVVLFIMVL